MQCCEKWYYFINSNTPFISIAGDCVSLLAVIIYWQTLRQISKQSSTIEKQQFDSTFFQLISIHHNILNSIDLRTQGIATSIGHDCFKVFYERLHEKLKIDNPDNVIGKDVISLDKALLSFGVEYNRSKGDLNHYFYNLYNIFSYIDNSKFRNEKFYANTIISQLSAYEQYMLFYFALSDFCAVDFKSIIESYHVFKNLFTNFTKMNDTYIDTSLIGTFKSNYSKSAFED